MSILQGCCKVIYLGKLDRGNPPSGGLPPVLDVSCLYSQHPMGPTEDYPPALEKASTIVPKVCSQSHSGLTSHLKNEYGG